MNKESASQVYLAQDFNCAESVLRMANEDLKLRGPGEFFGNRQHGLPSFKIADIVRDISLLKESQRQAEDILKRDETLSSKSYAALKTNVATLFEQVGIGALN